MRRHVWSAFWVLLSTFMGLVADLHAAEELRLWELPTFDIVVRKTYDLDLNDVQFIDGPYPLLVKMRDEQKKELGYFAICDIDLNVKVKFPYPDVPIIGDRGYPIPFSIIPSRGANYFIVQALYYNWSGISSILYDRKGQKLWTWDYHSNPEPTCFINVSDRGISIRATLSCVGDVACSPLDLTFIDTSEKVIAEYKELPMKNGEFSEDGKYYLIGLCTVEPDQSKKEWIAFMDGRGKLLWKKCFLSPHLNIYERQHDGVRSYSLSPDGQMITLCGVGLSGEIKAKHNRGTVMLDAKGKVLFSFPNHDLSTSDHYNYSDDGTLEYIELSSRDEDKNKSYIFDVIKKKIVVKSPLSRAVFFQDSHDLIGISPHGGFLQKESGAIEKRFFQKGLAQLRRTDQFLFIIAGDRNSQKYQLVEFPEEIHR